MAEQIKSVENMTLEDFIGKEIVFVVEYDGVVYHDQFIGHEVYDNVLWDIEDRYVTLEYAKEHLYNKIYNHGK